MFVLCKSCGNRVDVDVDPVNELLHDRTVPYHCLQCGYSGIYGYYPEIKAECSGCHQIRKATFLIEVYGTRYYFIGCSCGVRSVPETFIIN